MSIPIQHSQAYKRAQTRFPLVNQLVIKGFNKNQKENLWTQSISALAAESIIEGFLSQKHTKQLLPLEFDNGVVMMFRPIMLDQDRGIFYIQAVELIRGRQQQVPKMLQEIFHL